MKQHSLSQGVMAKRSRRRLYLAEMEKAVPRADLVIPLSAFSPEGNLDLSIFSPMTTLRIHFMQRWLALSDTAMEAARHDMPEFRGFAGLEGWDERLPDESTILRFRHVLKKHKLATEILRTVIRSEWSSASSDTSRCATADWPRTRRNCHMLFALANL